MSAIYKKNNLFHISYPLDEIVHNNNIFGVYIYMYIDIHVNNVLLVFIFLYFFHRFYEIKITQAL